MTEPEPTSDLRIENALLRSALWLTANALKNYHDSPHFEMDDEAVPKLEVIVPADARDKAADALARRRGY